MAEKTWKTPTDKDTEDSVDDRAFVQKPFLAQIAPEVPVVEAKLEAAEAAGVPVIENREAAGGVSVDLLRFRQLEYQRVQGTPFTAAEEAEYDALEAAALAQGATTYRTLAVP